jgi:HEAT repeat protein
MTHPTTFTFDSFDMPESSNPFKPVYFLYDAESQQQYQIDENTKRLQAFPLSTAPGWFRQKDWLISAGYASNPMDQQKTIDGRFCDGFTIGVPFANPWVAEAWFDSKDGFLVYANVKDRILSQTSEAVWTERVLSYSAQPLPPEEFKIPQQSADELSTYKCEFVPADKLALGSEGLIDRTGKIITLPNVIGVCEFSDGLAVASKKTGAKFEDRKTGYLNKQGYWAIKPQFDIAYPFVDGLACILVKGRYGFIDKKGQFVIQPTFFEAGGFSDGLAPACLYPEKASDEPVKWGFIDKSGQFVIKPQFDSVLGFSEGLAAVLVKDKYGFIDKAGKLVIEPQFLQADFFSEGLCCILLANGNEAYIDRTGHKAFAAEFRHLVGAGIGNERIFHTIYYLDDKTRALVLGSRSLDGQFHNGVVSRTEIGNSGFELQSTDRHGNRVPSKPDTSLLSEGLKPDGQLVGNQYLYGYLDQNNKVVIPYQFSSASKFSDGFAKVSAASEPIQKSIWKKIQQVPQAQIDNARQKLNSLSSELSKAKTGARGPLCDEYLTVYSQIPTEQHRGYDNALQYWIDKDKSVAKSVVAFLDSSDDGCRETAINTLSDAACEWALRHNAFGFPSMRPELGGCAIDLPASSLPTLVHCYQSGGDGERKRLTLVLASIHEKYPQVKQLLIDSLKNDKSWEVRAESATALGEIGRDEGANCSSILTVLCNAIDNDPQIVCYACGAISKLGKYAEPAVPALRKVLKSNGGTTCLQAMVAISQIGPPAKSAVPELMSLLRNDDIYEVESGILPYIGEALGAVLDEEEEQKVLPELQNMLKGPHELGALYVFECKPELADKAKSDLETLAQSKNTTIAMHAEFALKHKRTFEHARP